MTEQQADRLRRARDLLLDVQVQALTARELLLDADDPSSPPPDLPASIAQQAKDLPDTISEVVSGIGSLLGEQ